MLPCCQLDNTDHKVWVEDANINLIVFSVTLWSIGPPPPQSINELKMLISFWSYSVLPCGQLDHPHPKVWIIDVEIVGDAPHDDQMHLRVDWRYIKVKKIIGLTPCSSSSQARVPEVPVKLVSLLFTWAKKQSNVGPIWVIWWKSGVIAVYPNNKIFCNCHHLVPIGNFGSNWLFWFKLVKQLESLLFIWSLSSFGSNWFHCPSFLSQMFYLLI